MKAIKRSCNTCRLKKKCVNYYSDSSCEDWKEETRGRKNGQNYPIQIAVRMSKRLLEAIEKEAGEEDRKTSSMIRQILKERYSL